MQIMAVAGKHPSEVGPHGRLRRRTAILFALSPELFQLEVSMDFDPRSIDESRDRDQFGRELSQGSRLGLSNPRERERLDARDVFTRELELPRGRERERVWARDSDVTLRGSEVRTLAMPLDEMQSALVRQRLTQNVHESRGLGEKALQLGKDCCLLVRLEVHLLAADLAVHQAGSGQLFQLALNRADGAACVSDQLAQVVRFVGVAE